MKKGIGAWSSSVLRNIAKTMLSSDLKEYSRKNQKIIILRKLRQVYNNEELINLFNKGIEIDSGEHDCEILEPVYSNSRGNKRKGCVPEEFEL